MLQHSILIYLIRFQLLIKAVIIHIRKDDIEHLIERAVPHVIHDLHLCLVDLAAEVVPAQLGHGEHRLLGGGLHLGPETLHYETWHYGT